MNAATSPFPLNAWYAAAYDVEVRHALLARTVCNQKLVLYRAHRRPGRGAGRRLLAPADAAVAGPARRRRAGLRLPRPGLQQPGPLHPHAEPGDAQPLGLRARLPGGREAPLRLGLARRPGQGRPGAGARHALERRPGLGRRRQDDPRGLRLPAGGRQPDGPDARDLRARLARSATARWPRRPSSPPTATAPPPSRAGWRTSTRRRSGPRRSACARLRGQGRPLADHPLRRRRARSTSTSAWPRPAAARCRATARRATAARASTATCSTPSRPRPTRPASTSGPSRATTASASSASRTSCARAWPASSARTSWCSRRSSAPSTSGPTTASTTSTSTPARCGRAG